jgi:UDP-2,3-diacylglucosamine hydrolase
VGNLLFASDFHLGVPNATESLIREKKLVKWLELKASSTDEFFFVGDVFDFWFEYKYVVPKGYTRLFGCLATLADAGKKLHFFKGNHDMWMFGYFKDEFGATIHNDEYIFEKDGKKFFVHHGDGLGHGDANYKMLKKVLEVNCVSAFLPFYTHLLVLVWQTIFREGAEQPKCIMKIPTLKWKKNGWYNFVVIL